MQVSNVELIGGKYFKKMKLNFFQFKIDYFYCLKSNNQAVVRNIKLLEA